MLPARRANPLSKRTKIVLIGAGAVGAGVGVYFLWKWYARKRKLAKEEARKDEIAAGSVT